MGRGVPIPEYVSRTEPSLVPGPRASAPRIAAPAGQAISEAGNQLLQIATVQAEHKRQLDMLEADSKMTSAIGQAHIDALSKPDPAFQAQAFQDAATQGTDTVINDPAYAHIAPELKARANTLITDGRVNFAIKAATAQAEYTQQRVLNDAKNAIPDLATKAEPQRTQAADAYKAIFRGAMLPAEAEKASQEFDHTLNLQQLMNVAVHDPLHLEDAISSASMPINTQDHLNLVSVANSSMLRPTQERETAYKAQETAYINDLNARKAKGEDVSGEALGLGYAGKIAMPDAERLAGHPLEMPLVPSNVEHKSSIIASMDRAPTVDRIDEIIAGLSGDKAINEQDKAILRQHGESLKKDIDSPLKQADRAYGGAGGWISDQYKPKTEADAMVWTILNPLAAGQEAKARNYYETYAAGLTSKEEKRKLAEEAVKLYPLPPPLTIDPKTAAKVNALAPELVTKYAPKARGVSVPPGELPATSITPEVK